MRDGSMHINRSTSTSVHSDANTTNYRLLKLSINLHILIPCGYFLKSTFLKSIVQHISVQ
uniref:Ovule protein n=1 Tax=Ascaris lumbricoides TaxID=6252 RepID=A0A0M3IEM1_ASCLU